MKKVYDATLQADLNTPAWGGNKLIMDFMNANKLLPYHEKWDDLMPVIKKINSIPQVSNYETYAMLVDSIFSSLTHTLNIVEVWNEVITFITWYNSTIIFNK